MRGSDRMAARRRAEEHFLHIFCAGRTANEMQEHKKKYFCIADLEKYVMCLRNSLDFITFSSAAVTKDNIKSCSNTSHTHTNMHTYTNVVQTHKYTYVHTCTSLSNFYSNIHIFLIYTTSVFRDTPHTTSRVRPKPCVPCFCATNI